MFYCFFHIALPSLFAAPCISLLLAFARRTRELKPLLLLSLTSAPLITRSPPLASEKISNNLPIPISKAPQHNSFIAASPLGPVAQHLPQPLAFPFCPKVLESLICPTFVKGPNFRSWEPKTTLSPSQHQQL
ncbi:hypothetical protein DY000_02053662 [Brassica cretica]|uniref:Uncharacterized protein n=1 Tax=Brassica cretica TaxID=69181 RepID=A0ABQ7AIG3_BRACR|nr:hypothetical protein DY000_02053662 [Brassica cretica]